jgi:DNA-binding beta-propeller fold protein YncE
MSVRGFHVARIRIVACVSLVMTLMAIPLTGCGGTAATGGPARVGASRSASPGARQGCSARMRLTATEFQSIGRGAGPLAVDGTAVWVARPRAGTLTRVTTAGRTVIHVGAAPISLAVGFGKLWVAERDANQVVLIDTRTLSQTVGASLSVPVSVVVGPVGVWALSLDAGALYQLDPVSGGAASPIDSPVLNPSAMVTAGEDLWVLGSGDHGLSPVNGKLSRIVRAGFDQPGQALSGLSAAGTNIWLGEPGRRSLLRVDARTVAVQELPAPDDIQPTSTATGVCGVWVADASGNLAIADLHTAAPLGPSIHVGRSIAALAPSGTGVWVSDPIDGTLVRVEVRSAG